MVIRAETIELEEVKNMEANFCPNCGSKEIERYVKKSNVYSCPECEYSGIIKGQKDILIAKSAK